MNLFRPIAAALGLILAAPVAAQEAAPPKLIVVISIDQFSADLFAEYRAQFRFGFARLMSGAVFPAGYQGHAATETCPGHSTILTGSRPARTGIVGNDWIDFKSVRGEKPNFTVYCAEDESVPGSTSSNYTVSAVHLKVPTLGEWMKAANPGSRVVSVAGKDRAAVMMGGHKIDEIWYWGEGGFVSFPGRATPPAVTAANAAAAKLVADGQPPLPLPDFCKAREQAYPVGKNGLTVGTGRFEREPGKGSKVSPEFDAAIAGLAGDLAVDMKLGQGAAPDLLIVGASGTDYVGHALGTGGTEMCIQMLALDRTLGKLFDRLDATGVDYAAVLTADHGGYDMPERAAAHGMPMAARVATVENAEGKRVAVLSPARLSETIAAKLKLKIDGPVLIGGVGEVFLSPKLSAKQRKAVLAEALAIYRADPQVYGAYTRAEIEATPSPKGPPETWTMLERARASYDPARTGDILIALKPRVSMSAVPGPGYVATHGSFWDYDRRVPILFWRRGMTGFEQPLSVETADIAPTLAGLLHIPVPVEIDGRCLDLDAGPGDSCKP